MAYTLHFVGGPLDGRLMAWDEAPPTFRVPSQPVMTAVSYSAEATAPILHETLIYERRHGVVAREATYDWRPT